ncbi:alpha-amylase [Chryseobacterium flavum]|uniref:alpha-amylase n=1 Tax=Chryseobacterium flavum TaxID=415851 RepID=UPI0028B12BD7|nr:alpha-amylase [Chryseobacterium flavum]
MNGVIIQFFHWYHQGNLWQEFVKKADVLKSMGFSAVWFPPATKCVLGIDGRGYDVYDLYDLGEFDQKGSVATRFGTRDEYLKAIEKAHEAGISVYADIVLNHRMGGDEKEEVTVHKVNEENRNEMIGEPFSASAFTKFTFPGRKGQYSDFIWDYRCFSGIDIIYKEEQEEKGVFKIHNEYGEDWNPSVSSQFGNYDYLMGNDVEYRNPYVVQEMKNWIRWYVETTGIDGLRLDALKHLSSDFLKDWITYIKAEVKDCFIMGEFWKDKVEKISDFSGRMDDTISFFDVPLHYNFFRASKEGKDYDLRNIIKDTFLEWNPMLSVSFVENHDTQRFQALESAVKDWFKPIAYTLILMSENAYPCVFYPDLFSAEYAEMKDDEEVKVIMPRVEILTKLLEARQQFAYGEQVNWFDHPNCIAWLRKGDGEHPGCVVIISNSEDGYKEITVDAGLGGAVFYDFLQHRKEEVVLDEQGKGIFHVASRSSSIWVMKNH